MLLLVPQLFVAVRQPGGTNLRSYKYISRASCASRARFVAYFNHESRPTRSFAKSSWFITKPMFSFTQHTASWLSPCNYLEFDHFRFAFKLHGNKISNLVIVFDWETRTDHNTLLDNDEESA